MTFAEKKPGHCIGCATPVYEIHPNGAVGRMLDCGTQVEFLLSNGTECDIAFCVECASALRPEHFRPMWDAVIALTERTATTPNARVLGVLQLQRAYPVTVLRWRREDPGRPGMMTVDRRCVHAAA